MRVGIVIPSLRPALLFRCLGRLHLIGVPKGTLIALVCDEWGDDDLTLIQTVYPDLTKIMLASPSRLGVCRAFNRGVKALLKWHLHWSCDAIAILNDDVLVRSGWLDALISALEEHPEFGLVVATSVDPNGSGPIGIAGCSLHTRESLDRIGLFDEAFYGYGGDYDYHLRALAAGYLPTHVVNAIVDHRPGSTLGELGKQESHVQEVLSKLWSKHGGVVDAGTLILPPPKFPVYDPEHKWRRRA